MNIIYYTNIEKRMNIENHLTKIIITFKISGNWFLRVIGRILVRIQVMPFAILNIKRVCKTLLNHKVSKVSTVPKFYDWRGFVFFYFKLFDKITILSCVFLDNFRPCLSISS